MKYFFCKKITLIFLTLSALFSSCGYQMGNGDNLISRFNTLSVPYVLGDQEGTLTSAIIKEVVKSGNFNYQDSEGALILQVKKLDLDEDNIGFRYDRKKRGTLTKDIIPTETRVSMFVEISVIESVSCKILIAPVRLSASFDYDHDYYSSRDGINIFSLGQLSDLDAAYDAVQEPLNRLMAEKIVDYISQCW